MNEYVDIDLMFDVLDRDNVRDGLTNQDLSDSRDFPIRVCYDLVDLDRTSYNFRQKFTEDDTRLYFERMRVICSSNIVDLADMPKDWHFHQSCIRGKLFTELKKLDKRIA